MGDPTHGRADKDSPPGGAGYPDADAAARLAAWFAGAARELPWRREAAGWRDPYMVLVAEVMLQQTQVSRVLERFESFMARFPTVQALADADERDVLAAWSGLGYYRRARSLHGAAKMIVAEHGGRFPGDPTTILELPGVGRYTAGAIASLAFGLAEPIVDGNVARVLLRLHGREAASDDREVQGWLWERAGALVRAAAAPGVVNEAIMELGATVCTPPPSIPRCERCPLRNRCIARIEGRQLEIPRPKTRPVRTVLHCAVAVVERSDSSLLIEQRPTEGLWGAMWQAPTLESADSTPTAANLGAALGLDPRLLRPDAVFEHGTTHRRVLFRVWRAAGPASFVPRRGLWMPLVRIEALGLSNPQRRILLESARGGTLFT